jgi:hypothetical protein
MSLQRIAPQAGTVGATGPSGPGAAVLYVYKTVNTSVSNQTTSTADPELVLALPSTGTWELFANLIVSGGNGGGGFRGRWGYTGSTTLIRNSWQLSPGTSGGTDPYNVGSVTMYAASGEDAGANYAYTETTFPATGGQTVMVHSRMVVIVSTTGNIQYLWGQRLTSGTASVMRVGSDLTARKLI